MYNYTYSQQEFFNNLCEYGHASYVVQYPFSSNFERFCSWIKIAVMCDKYIF